ncbi:FxSxx-COOH cyclophane-containing RiPP peptide, partial [Streptomyces sp. NRRL F-2664]|uniref:FxSxx-COOH cyclophane-containing RiPP peptide n=1 Tax=Streptomyces sp. NRRL F-2664 TaxID=1463842 RepID=UPI000D13EFD8
MVTKRQDPAPGPAHAPGCTGRLPDLSGLDLAALRGIDHPVLAEVIEGLVERVTHPAWVGLRVCGGGDAGRWLLGRCPRPRASSAGGAGFCCSVSVLCGVVPRRSVSSARRVRAIAAVLGGRALVLRGHSAVSPPHRP